MSLASAEAQNVVNAETGPVRPAIRLSLSDVQRVLDHPLPAPKPLPAQASKFLDEVLHGGPWRPLHLTLGISGFETYFTHPDELFFVLSLLPPSEPVREFLQADLKSHPPYAAAGYRLDEGKPRERYDVPLELIPARLATAADCFGIYSFWLYCRRLEADSPEAARTARNEHWPAVKDRARPLLDAGFPFDPARRDYKHDEAEHLNGNIAGLIGIIRLGAEVGDSALDATARERLREGLEARVNLERVNTLVWTPTHFASKTLHTGKLARFLKLTPETGFALREWSDGCAEKRLASLRRRFSTWWIAAGDRLVGGENFISPLHFSRALWQGLAWIETDPKRFEGVKIDVPWCHADLAFIEKSALRAMAAGSR